MKSAQVAGNSCLAAHKALVSAACKPTRHKVQPQLLGCHGAKAQQRQPELLGSKAACTPGCITFPIP